MSATDCEHPECFEQGYKACQEDMIIGKPGASFEHKPYVGSTPEGRDWFLGYSTAGERMKSQLTPA